MLKVWSLKIFYNNIFVCFLIDADFKKFTNKNDVNVETSYIRLNFKRKHMYIFMIKIRDN